MAARENLKATPNMYTKLILTLGLSTALLSGAAGQEARGKQAAAAEDIGVLPDQKTAMALKSTVDPEARNPFAARTIDEGLTIVQDTRSEEGRIRAVLDGFIVNGIAKSSNGGYSAQLESIILKEGQLLPRLLKDQVDQLRVTKITDRLVEITWVGDEDAEKPRQVAMKVDMTPTVEVVLPQPKGVPATTVAVGSGNTSSASR
jgi:hypothetical protein